MARWIAILVTAASIAACSKKHNEGLPPAQQWSADQPGVDLPDPSDDPHGMGPHGGTADPSDPHAGVDMANPHAGVDMANPHAGVDMASGAGDVGALGLPPPDPNRKIDPTHHIRGVIAVDPKAKAHVADGGIVFLYAQRADAGGQPSGMPIAVAKLTYTGADIPFSLDETQEMTGVTGDLSGDVVVTAHYDQDGEARTKQPGDVTGMLRVQVPADNVKISLDTIVP